MVVKNLFEQEAFDGIIERLNQISPSSERQWGKMNAAQMMAHCIAAFKVPLANRRLPKLFPLSLVGPLFKKKLYDDKAWKPGLPTAPDFKIRDERDFETEKKNLISIVTRFHDAGPTGAGQYPHPVFGKFTPEQWGKAMWKHLDHHLRQFGI